MWLGGKMAHFRGDGGRKLEEAIREKDLRRKVELMEDALVLHFAELEQVFEHLGPENFDAYGLKKLGEEIGCTE